MNQNSRDLNETQPLSHVQSLTCTQKNLVKLRCTVVEAKETESDLQGLHKHFN